ncbi:hypothetical protein [Sphingobacterium gobiense]|uniref:Fimbrillin family protein n=1 Tax=Sphingobacterium gobiense TaxID=1382456 RepID=A0A2S9JGF5_9SPHI|nr:hypothetical protein [Sphingobacterium gobiense]PRD52034.1 hypothetical protein C5749_17210 [Sphingobacterium gobiense]
MKKIYTNSMGKLATGVLLALGTVFATGCAKDAKQDIAEDGGEGTRVVIRVAGVNDGQGSPALKGKAGGSTSASIAEKAELIESDGFDVFVSQSNKIDKSANLVAKRANSFASGALRSDAMDDGFSYRLFLYESGSIAASELFMSGTPGSIAVEKGKSYTWFALSYNSTDEVPVADGSNMVDLVAGQDVLYASGEFEVANSDGDVVVPLSITFDHKLSRVAIELNTMGMFAPINSANVTVKGLNLIPDAINITTGEFVGDTEQNVTISFNDFQPLNAEGDRLIYNGYYGGNASENITVEVSNLVIDLDESAGENATRNFGSSKLTQQFAVQPGMNQSVVLGFVESPLTYGGVQWSRSPLYYTGNRSATSVAQLSHNPYRFYHANPALTASNPEAYFSYGGAIPGRLARQTNPQDPCALVYPAGLWKTPSSGNLSAIKSNGLTGLLEALNLNVAGTLDALVPVLATLAANVSGATAVTGPNAQQFTPSAGVNPAYAATPRANTLRFNYNGMMKEVSAVEGLVELSLGNTAGRYAAFWTNDRALGLPLDIANLGVMHYLGHTHSGVLVLNPGPKAYQATNLLSVDLVGIDVLKSSLMNVRCVRDASWNPAAIGYNPTPDYSVIFN